MNVPPTEAEFLGNTVDLQQARARSLALHPSRREAERREAAAQQAADLKLAAEATLQRASFMLERAEPLAGPLAAAASAVTHLIEALRCEQAARPETVEDKNR